MAKLVFDETGKRYYETGVQNCALYVYDKTNSKYKTGVAWNGITQVSHSPEGADDSDYYADNIKYLTLRSTENFKGSLTCYSTPEEFDACDGTLSLGGIAGVKVGQQSRLKFSLVYKTNIGNDTEGSDLGYKLHIIYNCSAGPSQRDYSSINDSPEPIELSYDFSSTPVTLDGYKAISHVEVDSRTVDKDKLAELEKKLYGDGTDETTSQPTLLMPNEIIELFNGTTSG